ncbi:MAG: 3'-5' exonuclease domain-containing protein 2 [Bacteroidales bacterium]|nr:3'-5' exonuclease domain-containing protein 2 [Bacteroidales bacterium]
MFVKSITTEEIYQLPLAAFDGEIVVIDKIDQHYRAALRYLSSKKIIGFDTESRPSFTAERAPYGVSLLQLSGADRAFLFRLKAIGLQPGLCKLLASPDIIKVGAAVHDDLHGLRKLSEFTPGGFVDLQQLVSEYGIQDKSVKKMAAIILGVRISKTQQLSNWEAETLSEPQRKYAATDAWICREMYKKLIVSPKNPLNKEESHG